MSTDRYELARLLHQLLPAGQRRHRYAAPPLIGYLELPNGKMPQAPSLLIQGWVFSRGRDVRRLVLTTNVGTELEVNHRLHRPDVAEEFPGEPHAHASGFNVALPLAGEGGALRELELWAYLDDGRRVRCFRLPWSAANGVRRGAPAGGAFTARALTAGRRALDAGALRLERARLEREVAQLLARLRSDEAGAPPDAGALTSALLDEYALAGGLRALARDLAAALAPPRPAPRREPSAARAGERRSILFVCGMCPSLQHGGGLRLFDLVSELARRHDVELYARYREHTDRASLEALLPRLGAARLVRTDELDGTDVLAWMRRRGRERYDVIHFEYPGSIGAIGPLRERARRTLYTMMESQTRAASIELARAAADGAGLGPAGRALLKSMRLERDALSGCDLGIAVTDSDAGFAARALGVAVPRVIPTCVSEAGFLDGLPSPIERADDRIARRSAVFLGYFEHRPNRDALAWYLGEIHPRARARVADYRVYVVGRGDLARERAAHAADPSIVFVGEVEDLRPHLLAAQIGLAPIVSGAGIRGKINQYSAAGRPTVATALGASGMQYTHRESIWIADSADGFADGIAALVTDAALWRRVRGAALDVVREHYLWPATVRRLEALYDE